MGYYSDVKIFCGKNVYDKVMECIRDMDRPIRPDKVTTNGKYFILDWFNIKWMTYNFPETRAIEKVLDSFYEEYGDDNAYHIVMVGEDNATHEEMNEASEECDCGIETYITTEIVGNKGTWSNAKHMV